MSDGENGTGAAAVEQPASGADGRWDEYYKKQPQRSYGDDQTYKLGAAWLQGLQVEDWGCGLGWMRHFVPKELYRGIDGSLTPFADEVYDLRRYRSQTPGLFMRHILEHNDDWEPILENALASFQNRMVLILFTPFVPATKVLTRKTSGPWIGIPDIAFAKKDLMPSLQPFLDHEESLKSGTYYGLEHVFYLEKKS